MRPGRAKTSQCRLGPPRFGDDFVERIPMLIARAGETRAISVVEAVDHDDVGEAGAGRCEDRDAMTFIAALIAPGQWFVAEETNDRRQSLKSNPPKEKSSSRPPCWSFKHSGSRSRCPHATHEGQRVGSATAFTRCHAMEATQGAEQRRAGVEADHLDDVFHRQFTST